MVGICLHFSVDSDLLRSQRQSAMSFTFRASDEAEDDVDVDQSNTMDNFVLN